MTPEALDSLDKAALIRLVLALEARVAELEARLNEPPKSPDNSSLPPSRGDKANRPDRPAKPRKGRPGVFRALASSPDRVRGLRRSLSGLRPCA